MVKLFCVPEPFSLTTHHPRPVETGVSFSASVQGLVSFSANVQGLPARSVVISLCVRFFQPILNPPVSKFKMVSSPPLR